MIQINLKHVKKEWGDEELFSDISFSVEFGERVGLVGMNGAGKSTLLQILTGRIHADSGEVFIPERASVALLPQNPLSDGELDRLEQAGFPDDAKMYMSLLGLDPWRTTGLSFFSGGERTKLALALLLAREPKLLLLDEPTNHLDYDGTRMLVRLLGEYPGTILTVSHDRYFLDETVSRILEIDQGRIVGYEGNYSDYRDEKARHFQENMRRWEDGRREQKRIADAISQKKQWSEKAHRDSTKPDSSGLTMGVKEKKRAKAMKMDRKVKSDIRRLERLAADVGDRPREEKTVRFAISAEVSHGRRILEASCISKSFDGQVLFADSSFTVARGEHVALWGPNGCGKSTLIAMLTGEVQPDSGDLRISPTSRPFVLPQTFAGFTQKGRTMDYLLQEIGHLSGDDRALLANLGITARHLSQPLCTLSFGEQMKIKLAEPILAQREFIILDEPTNHLDLPMREMLENTLAEYPGTLLLVSHDIYFLKKTCDKVIVFESGKIRRLEYSFSEYLEKQAIYKGTPVVE